MDDLHWLGLACELAALCPPSDTAYSVGAVLVDGAGRELARAYSREIDPLDHAEEAVLKKVPTGAVIYSSLEPCRSRASRPRSCTELILAAGIPRVVFAWREPPRFVRYAGAGLLAEAGVEVVELPQFADAAREPNRHLL